MPVVFAKKARSINLDGDQYATTIYSFTKQREYPVIVGRRFLSAGENVLIIDDYLANGCALEGLIRLCDSAGVNVAGIGIAVEKAFQGGGGRLRERGGTAWRASPAWPAWTLSAGRSSSSRRGAGWVRRCRAAGRVALPRARRRGCPVPVPLSCAHGCPVPVPLLPALPDVGLVADGGLPAVSHDGLRQHLLVLEQFLKALHRH